MLKKRRLKLVPSLLPILKYKSTGKNTRERIKILQKYYIYITNDKSYCNWLNFVVKLNYKIL